MSEAPLSSVKACVFDAYGTLFDVNSAVARHGKAIGDDADTLSALWRTKQLEYTWLRSLMGQHRDFWAVTGDALDFALESTGHDEPVLRSRLMEAYLALDAYPEVPEVLERLAAHKITAALLSNGTPEMLAAAVGNSGIAAHLKMILSIEEVGIYKPHPTVYQLAVDRLRVEPSEIAFLSSNAWDIAGRGVLRLPRHLDQPVLETGRTSSRQAGGGNPLPFRAAETAGYRRLMVTPGRQAACRERQFTARDGLKLFYRDYPAQSDAPATPVLCLAGLTRNSRDFEDVAARLAPARRVVAPDYRGRGRSAYDPDWRNYQPETYLHDIEDLLAVAGLERFVVIGTSLGGLLGMALALSRPSGVAGLVMNDVGPELHREGIDRIVERVGTDQPQKSWGDAAAFLRTNFAFLNRQGEDDWLKLARRTFRQGEDGLLHYDYDLNIARALRIDRGDVPDLWQVFKGLANIPVLVVRGGESDVLSPETFDRMAAEKPDLQRVTIPAVGHAPLLDEPAAVAAIDAFLASIDGTPTATR